MMIAPNNPDATKTTADLFDKINMSEIFEKVKEDIKKETKQLNVFIIGKTGVGKSTLINAIFGKNVATTGSGSPVTQQIQMYQQDNLCIYDSKGLEVKDKSTIQQIEDFIKKQEQEDVKNQIHICLFCIQESGRRIEPADKDLYDMLKKHNFPVIVVITKATQDKDEYGEKFSDIVKETLKVDDEHLQRVNSIKIEDDDGYIKEPKGIKEVIQKTYSLLPEGLNNAFARKQVYDKAQKIKAMRESAMSLATKYSVAAGAVATSPIPLSDFAVILPTQIAMIAHISKEFELELNAESVKTLAVALVAVCGVGFAMKMAVGNLLKFIPVIGYIGGGAINTTVAAGTTKIMGNKYAGYLADNYDDIMSSGFDKEKVITYFKNNEKSIQDNIKDEVKKK